MKYNIIFFVLFAAVKFIKSEIVLLNDNNDINNHLNVTNKNIYPNSHVKELLVNSTIGFIERKCRKLSIPGIKLNYSPSCCHSLVNHVELAALCSRSENVEKEMHKELSDYQKNTCSNVKQIKEIKDKSTELVISSCVMLVEYLQNNEQERNLQSSFPPAPLSIISSDYSATNYEFQGNGPCALILSMYFIRTCGRECSPNRPPIAGVTKIPIVCRTECQLYSKDFCLTGCKRYGCSIDYYDCMSLLCGS